MKKIYIMMVAVILIVSAVGVAVASAGEGPFNFKKHHAMLERKAEILGLEVEDLKSKLVERKTLRDMFEGVDITGKDFAEKKLDWTRQRFDTFVGEGKITRENADEKLADMQERMENCSHKFDGSGRINKMKIKSFIVK